MRQAIVHGLVSEKILYADSTHFKTNANKDKFELKEVSVSPKDYLNELDKDVDKDKIEHNKKL